MSPVKARMRMSRARREVEVALGLAMSMARTCARVWDAHVNGTSRVHV